MNAYILKRILLIIPTFFAISLVLFIVLNVAPGKPGVTLLGADGAESENTAGAKREAYRIFKEQFNLDKPILVNTRFLLKEDDIENYLSTILNEDKAASSADLIKAQDDIEDLGQDAVPHLIGIIRRTHNLKIRDLAVRILSQNARQRLINPYGKNLSPAEKRINRETDTENALIRQLVFKPGDPEEKKQQIVSEWLSWFDTHHERYQMSALDKLETFFLDTRFTKYWWNLVRFDFGVSHVTKQPVFSTIISKLKYSITLSFTAILIAYFVSIPLGIFSAVKQDSRSDRVLTAILFMLYSLPNFFVGTLLLKYLSQGSDLIHLFPTGGFQRTDYADLTTIGQFFDIVWHITLPLVCLTYAAFASLSRYARSGLLEVIRSDYIRTARAKGLSEPVVILKHAVRNGMIPILTLLGTILPTVIGGSIIIEYIFGIPGMGLLTWDSIMVRDYNMIMGIQLISALLVLIGLLISDISYALVDPRISFK